MKPKKLSNKNQKNRKNIKTTKNTANHKLIKNITGPEKPETQQERTLDQNKKQEKPGTSRATTTFIQKKTNWEKITKNVSKIRNKNF